MLYPVYQDLYLYKIFIESIFVVESAYLENPNEAHLWLLNSCAVKSPSEESFFNDIRKAKELNKRLVLAGCVPQGQKIIH